eukprot:5297865-Alexandrium_andersonii.AAC.1
MGKVAAVPAQPQHSGPQSSSDLPAVPARDHIHQLLAAELSCAGQAELDRLAGWARVATGAQPTPQGPAQASQGAQQMVLSNAFGALAQVGD